MIANKTTSVPANKTVSEIQSMLSLIGATSLMIGYQRGEPDSIAFQIEKNGRSISFRLPANWKSVMSAMEKDKSIPRRLVCESQARRVSWRVIRDWLRAQLTLIECNASTIEEVMLPWAVTSDGTTVGQRLLNGDGGFLALPAPSR